MRQKGGNRLTARAKYRRTSPPASLPSRQAPTATSDAPSRSTSPVAETLPSVTVRYGCEYMSFRQDADSVTAEVSEGGKTSAITAKYLVGCDGGTSAVRKQLGIQLHGEGNIL